MNGSIIIHNLTHLIHMKKKSHVLTNEQIPQINYKQLSKLRHLNEECQQLTTLKKQLSQINAKSKNILQHIQEGTTKSKLNLTACSLGNILQSNFPEDQLEQLHLQIMNLKDFMLNKQISLQNRIEAEQKSKRQDQVFYRKILYNYEQKITELKNTVLDREGYIQKIQKQKKQNKDVTIETKILTINSNNLSLIEECFTQRDKFQKLCKQGIQLKVSINNMIEDLKKLQNLGLKFKLAKQTKMPYYKFMDILKNGIERMTQFDIRQYEFISKVNEEKKKNVTRTQTQQISKQSLHLILRKQRLNKQFLLKLIRQQNIKQEQLKEKNNKLKQAILLRQQKNMYKMLEGLIETDQNYFYKTKFKSLSQAGGAAFKRKSVKLQSRIEEYRTYFKYLKQEFKKCIPEYFFIKKRSLVKSKSHKIFIKKWDQEAERVPYEDNKHESIFKQSFYEKCNNFITDRFYDQQQSYDVQELFI